MPEEPAAAATEPAPDALQHAWACEADEGRFADVTFEVEGTAIPAMRAPLAIASPVFKAMLFGKDAGQGEWRESRSGEAVVLRDIGPGDFRALVRYAYRLEVSLSLGTVLQVRKAADKYQMDDLVEMCDQFIQGAITDNNPDHVLTLLDSAQRTCQERFVATCVPHIASLGNELLTCRAFRRAHARTVELVLASIPRDPDLVWRACRAWAEVQAGGGPWQGALAPLCPLIDFKSMCPLTFAAEVAQQGLLTCEEEVAVFRHMVLDPSNTLQPSVSFDAGSAGPDTSFPASDIVQFLPSNTTHRQVFVVPGVAAGTHSWTVTWNRLGCCGLVGIAADSEMSRGSVTSCDREFARKRLLDSESCFFMGYSTGHVAQSVEKVQGIRVAITVDMSRKVASYRNVYGQVRHSTFAHEGKVHLAIDSDEGNEFRVQYGVHLPAVPYASTGPLERTI